jgi:hypothetical protein
MNKDVYLDTYMNVEEAAAAYLKMIHNLWSLVQEHPNDMELGDKVRQLACKHGYPSEFTIS